MVCLNWRRTKNLMKSTELLENTQTFLEESSFFLFTKFGASALSAELKFNSCEFFIFVYYIVCMPEKLLGVLIFFRTFSLNYM